VGVRLPLVIVHDKEVVNHLINWPLVAGAHDLEPAEVGGLSRGRHDHCLATCPGLLVRLAIPGRRRPFWRRRACCKQRQASQYSKYN
jgi:hypothetical protein